MLNEQNTSVCLLDTAVEFPMQVGDVCPDMVEMRPCSFTMGSVKT